MPIASSKSGSSEVAGPASDETVGDASMVANIEMFVYETFESMSKVEGKATAISVSKAELHEQPSKFRHYGVAFTQTNTLVLAVDHEKRRVWLWTHHKGWATKKLLPVKMKQEGVLNIRYIADVVGRPQIASYAYGHAIMGEEPSGFWELFNTPIRELLAGQLPWTASMAVPAQPQYPCQTCGKPLEFIAQYQRWYCRNCQRYV